MSYCRWGYHSDVYCYEHCDGGFVTHVAQNRRVSDDPYPELPEAWWLMDGDEALKIIRAQNAWHQMARVEPIGLPCDGKDYSDETEAECADRLEHLRSLGYKVPQGAIDMLREPDHPEPTHDNRSI